MKVRLAKNAGLNVENFSSRQLMLIASVSPNNTQAQLIFDTLRAKGAKLNKEDCDRLDPKAKAFLKERKNHEFPD